MSSSNIENNHHLALLLEKSPDGLSEGHTSIKSAHIPVSVLAGGHLVVLKGQLLVDGSVEQGGKIANLQGDITVNGRMGGVLETSNGAAFLNNGLEGRAIIRRRTGNHQSEINGKFHREASLRCDGGSVRITGMVEGGEIDIHGGGPLTIDKDVLDGRINLNANPAEIKWNPPVFIRGNVRGGSITANTAIYIEGDIGPGASIVCNEGEVICYGIIHPEAHVVSKGVKMPAVDESAFSYCKRRLREMKKFHPNLSRNEISSKIRNETVKMLLTPGVTADDLGQIYHDSHRMLDIFARRELNELFQPGLWQNRPGEMEEVWGCSTRPTKKKCPIMPPICAR